MSEQLSAYDRLKSRHRPMYDELCREIEAYARMRKRFFSQTEAGKDILSRWAYKDEWNDVMGSNSSVVFCEVLEEVASTNGWLMEEKKDKRQWTKSYKFKR
jgi:hypothetical protein